MAEDNKIEDSSIKLSNDNDKATKAIEISGYEVSRVESWVGRKSYAGVQSWTALNDKNKGWIK